LLKRIAPILLAVSLIFPIIGLIIAIILPDAADNQNLTHLWNTVLGGYALTTLILCCGVAFCTFLLGVGSAWMVANYEFVGKSVYEWALILPLALPAYVMAYLYVDFLQFSGPVQTVLRQLLGLERLAWFPEPRSIGGAIIVLSLCLYPYVYLLSRAAFIEKSPNLINAAMTLGLSAKSAFWRVALPLARPAIVAGLTLALMEVVADYGAVSYFGLQTFSTGIYRAWLSLGDKVAASQLAISLLMTVLLLVFLEQYSRRRMRFVGSTQRAKNTILKKLTGTEQFVANVLCLIPLALGFIFPLFMMLRLNWQVSGQSDHQLDSRYFDWLWNTLSLSAGTAAVAVIIGLFLAYTARVYKGRAQAWANRLVSLGYALPGSVLAVGILLFLGYFDLGWLLTGSVLVLMYAYLVRFLSSSLQSIEAGLAKITPSMDASAVSMGLNHLQVLWEIHLPLLNRSLLTAAIFVFVDVMKELPATLMLRPFNFDTLAVVTFQLASDERLAEAVIPAFTIVLAGLIPVFILSKSISKQ
jgi:iron(III) transport system permease protein